MEKSIKAHEKVLLCILVAILLLVALALSLHFVLVSNNTTSSQESTNLEENSSTSSTEVLVSQEPGPLVQFDGTYIQAELPENWNIVEYDDERGMGIGVMDVGYNGLTGFDINNAADQLIFQFRGIKGIGGPDVCSTIYQFVDTSPDYIQNKISTWDSFNYGSETKLLDLSGQDYTESVFLNRIFRRIEGNMYWKNPDSPEGVFNPECGGSALAITFSSVDTTSAGADSMTERLNLFSVNIISDNIQENELSTLDRVLESIRVK